MGLKRSGQWSPEAQNGIILSAGDCPPWTDRIRDQIWSSIHDGARPPISEEVIRRTIEAAREYRACVAAVPVKDTVKVADGDQFAETTLDRSLLWQIQTPQAFRYSLVKGAYDSLMADPALQKGITDDAMVVERMTNEKVKLVMGDYRNIKVTTPEDMTVAAAFLDDLKKM